MDETIRGETFFVTHLASIGTVVLSGTLRLNGLDEYAQISALMSRVANQEQPFTLDLRGLEFLNSSGIAMLSKFVIEMRNAKLDVTIKGNPGIAWQSKSLINLQRLMPSLKLEFD